MLFRFSLAALFLRGQLATHHKAVEHEVEFHRVADQSGAAPAVGHRCENVDCNDGFECGAQGACIPKAWDAAAVCVNASDVACQELVEASNAAAREWVLIITSSGGSGHLMAAQNLAWDYAISWRKRIESAGESLSIGRSLLTDEGYQGLSSTLTEVQNREPPAVKLDIMLSPCMSILGQKGQSMGKVFSEIWNDQQHNGNLETLSSMTDLQGFVDSLFSPSCYQFLKDTLLGHHMNYSGSPKHVISCQPIHLQSIAKAISDLQYEYKIPIILDEYITELPTEESKAFFDPIRTLTQEDWHSSQFMRLHIIKPLQGLESIASRTGLDSSQVVIEQYGPVSQSFKSAGTVPSPGTQAAITIKAGILEEEIFLGGKSKVFHIAPKDTVTLIMLGSQPTVSAVNQYRKAIMRLMPGPLDDGLHYVFVGCGDVKKAVYKKLFEKSVKDANGFNKKQRQSGGRLRIIPFSKQSITDLQGRSDVVLSRSGGMTCFELLALAARGDVRRILLHVEVEEYESPILLKGMVVVPGREPTTYEAWSEQVLRSGMLAWEMGNAKYIMRTLGAQVVVPSVLNGAHFHGS